MSTEFGDADIAVVGAGAAGLMAAIAAGREAERQRKALTIVALDSARKLGAKILVAGGGRCNVTHDVVDETAYAGSSRHAIKQVLRAFGVARTVEFFSGLGVTLKREETGKLFPTTDDAHTVLDALLGEARRLGVRLLHPWRVERITPAEGGRFRIEVGEPGAPAASVSARRIILTTGGKALPKSGSDGHGYAIARSLGHTLTERITPALVPLTLAEGSLVRALSGLTLPTLVEVWSGTGKRLAGFANSTLCTHFGLSGPSVLDISRYWIAARADDPAARLTINWNGGPELGGHTVESLDALLVARRGVSATRLLTELPVHLPERLARALVREAGVDESATLEHLRKDRRRALAEAVCRMTLPVTGDRGYTFAEVTAGGVPLAELRLDSMASRATPGLYLAGEILDVDGRIGGYNFQWAWASGHLAGTAAARSIFLEP